MSRKMKFGKDERQMMASAKMDEDRKTTKKKSKRKRAHKR